MKDYSGPAGAAACRLRRRIIDMYRFVSSNSPPSPRRRSRPRPLQRRINFGAAMARRLHLFGHSRCSDIKDGKIATMQVERVGFTVNMQASRQARQNDRRICEPRLARFRCRSALAAILDPQKANDDQYHRVYGKTTAGPYTVTSAQGLRMRIDGMTIDDVGVRPSRLQLRRCLR